MTSQSDLKAAVERVKALADWMSGRISRPEDDPTLYLHAKNLDRLLDHLSPRSMTALLNDLNPEFAEELRDRLLMISQAPALKAKTTHLSGELRSFSTIIEIAAKCLGRPLSPPEPIPEGEPPRPYPFAHSPDAKVSEAFVFEGGSLTVHTNGQGDANGTGWFCFREDDLEWDQADDSAQAYRIANLDRSEILALRDQLNKLWPLPSEPAPVDGEYSSVASASPTDEQLSEALTPEEKCWNCGKLNATGHRKWCLECQDSGIGVAQPLNRERAARAIFDAADDDLGNILVLGCQEHNYCDPEDAAWGTALLMADAIRNYLTGVAPPINRRGSSFAATELNPPAPVDEGERERVAILLTRYAEEVLASLGRPQSINAAAQSPREYADVILEPYFAKLKAGEEEREKITATALDQIAGLGNVIKQLGDDRHKFIHQRDEYRVRAEALQAALEKIAKPAMWSIGGGRTCETPSGLCAFARAALTDGGGE